MPRHRSTPVAAASDPAALELLKRSTEVAEDVEKMRTSVNMMTMDMEVIQDGRARTVMRMDTPDGEQELEMILLPPDMYTKVPDIGWVKVDMEMLAESAVSLHKQRLHLSEEQRARMKRELATPAGGIDDLIEQIELHTNHSLSKGGIDVR